MFREYSTYSNHILISYLTRINLIKLINFLTVSILYHYSCIYLFFFITTGNVYYTKLAIINGIFLFLLTINIPKIIDKRLPYFQFHKISTQDRQATWGVLYLSWTPKLRLGYLIYLIYSTAKCKLNVSKSLREVLSISLVPLREKLHS